MSANSTATSNFTPEELRLIEDARWEPWEDIAPERASNPDVREILFSIQKRKRHRQDP